LQTLNDKLKTGFIKYPDVYSLWASLATLEKVLEPNYITNLKLPDTAKRDLLIGYASQLKDLGKAIEDLQKLKGYVNITEFQGLEDHEKRLSTVAVKHAEQELQIEEASRQVHELLSAYSKITLQLSAQLVEWNDSIGKRH